MEKNVHVHLVSDSTGETLNAIVNAALAQFEGVAVNTHAFALVRSELQLQRAQQQVRRQVQQQAQLQRLLSCHQEI